MNRTYGLSLLVLIALGYSFGLQESREQRDPWEKIHFWDIFPDAEEKGLGSLLPGGGLRDKKSIDPASLFSVAKELQGFGKERAGFRFRFGRREDGNEVEDFESQGEEKRGDSPLGSLAEELNGYNRKKGGFNFRFGRR
ncbi:orexigenic neuropeptide QRFP [Spea bombifrons]|uniref:orexigenic neuropeptide QRFP n=1 Tax=Spea bombifrons TaxID=233779 RepID=UPI002349B1DA|nr:orexigenic neuropeptide QRFP [Spea bombifrons]